MKVGTRLAIAFGCIAILLAIFSIYVIVKMRELASTTENLYYHPYAVSVAIASAEGSILRIGRTMKDLTVKASPQSIETSAQFFDKYQTMVLKNLELARQLHLGDKTQFDSLIQNFKDWNQVRGTIIALLREGKIEEAESAIRVQDAEKAVAAGKLLGSIKESAAGEASAFNTNAARSSNQTISFVIVLDVLFAFASGGIAYVLAIGISRPLKEAVGLARRVAAGDLSTQIDVKGTDETGQLMQSLKEMNQSLAKIVGEVRARTTLVAEGSSQISTGNQGIVSTTTAQAAALEQTAAAVEALTSTVKHNSDNASHANQLAASASLVAIKGGVAVTEVVDRMILINESSRRIAEIVGVINGIAFQTNILALNAAVEAARAGEQGRGFAVVAVEVRSLAQRSASAAKEIQELIAQSVTNVNIGSQLVDQAGVTMNDIVRSVKQVSDIIGEITVASAEQSEGIEQISQAINDMNESTQRNAALVEQTNKGAETMHKHAISLADLVQVFKLSSRHSHVGQAKSPPLGGSESPTS